jgi:hypothetical protein
MSLKRKLVVAGVVLVLAGGVAAGAALAASGHARSAPAPRQLRLASVTKAGVLLATAQYLGTDVATLRHELKSGKTLAQVANGTSGRSAKQLATLLVAAASKRLQTISDRPMSGGQQQALAHLIRPRITGFLNDTCPLGLRALGKHLVGCPGMNG